MLQVYTMAVFLVYVCVVFRGCLAGVSLKHDGTDGTVNTDGTAIERADGADGKMLKYKYIFK